MAMATTNEILGSILNQIQVTNKYVGDIAKSKSNPSMDALTKPVQSPTASVSKESLGSTVSAIKTLSTVSIKDMAKIAIMPMGIVARKINNFVNELNKIEPAEAEAANNAVKAFDTITKSIMGINTIKLTAKLAVFPEKAMLKFVNFVGSYIEKLNKIPEQFTEDKQKTLEKAITGITSVSKNMLKAMGRTAIIGLTAPILIPLTTLGFVTIGLYLAEYNLMNKIVSKVGSDDNTEKGMGGLENIKQFTLGVFGLIGASLILGSLMVFPETRAILGIGFVSTLAVVLAIGGLQLAIDFVGKKVGSTESKLNVMNVVGFGAAAALIALSSIGIGLLIEETGIMPALKGFGAIMVVMGGLIGISVLMDIAGKKAEQSKKSVMPILALAVSSTLITLAAIGIGALIEATGDVIWKGLGAMGAVIGGFTAIGLAIGGATKLVGMKNIIAGNAVVMAIAGMSIYLTGKTVELGKKFEEGGGWKNLGNTLGAMGVLIGSFAAIITGFGALMLIPGAGAVVAMGTGVMLAIGGSILAISSAASSVIDYQNKIPAGGMDAPISSMISFIEKSKSILEAVKGIGKGISFISLTKTIFALKGIIWTMGSFTDILQKVGGKNGFIKSVSSYDDNGNPIYGEDIDVEKVSTNLTSAFSIFVHTIFNGNPDKNVLGLNQLDGKEISAAVILKIAMIMDPISKFATLIQTVGAEAGKIRTIKNYDDNGNPIYGDSIEISPIAENISSSFSTFAQNVLTGINKASAGLGDLYKAKIINDLIGPINTFANIVKEFNATDDPNALAVSVYDESGKLVKKEIVNVGAIGTKIATGFGTFAQKVTLALKRLKIGKTKDAKKKAEGMQELLTPIVDSVKVINDSLKEPDVTKFTKTIIELGAGISAIHKLYIDPRVVKLNKTLPELTKNHTKYINDISSSMKNAKSSMQKYREELEKITELYDTLHKQVNEAGDITLSVVEDNSTTYETNLGDVKNDVIEEMSKKLADMITAGFAQVLNGLSMDIPNMMKDNKSTTLTADFGCNYN